MTKTNTITVKSNTTNTIVSLSYKNDTLRSVNDFTIISFRKGGKGIQAKATFGNGDKVYTYNQKIMKQGKRTYVRMTGMNIYFDLATLEVTEAIKMVEVSGKRRGNNGSAKPEQTITESITEEIEDGCIEIPSVAEMVIKVMASILTPRMAVASGTSTPNVPQDVPVEKAIPQARIKTTAGKSQFRSKPVKDCSTKPCASR